MKTNTKPSFEVRCNQCKWMGMLDDLKPIFIYNPFNPDNSTQEPACPACLSDDMLEYKED